MKAQKDVEAEFNPFCDLCAFCGSLLLAPTIPKAIKGAEANLASSLRTTDYNLRRRAEESNLSPGWRPRCSKPRRSRIGLLSWEADAAALERGRATRRAGGGGGWTRTTNPVKRFALLSRQARRLVGTTPMGTRPQARGPARLAMERGRATRSGWPDSNRRSRDPQSRAFARLSYTPMVIDGCSVRNRTESAGLVRTASRRGTLQFGSMGAYTVATTRRTVDPVPLPGVEPGPHASDTCVVSIPPKQRGAFPRIRTWNPWFVVTDDLPFHQEGKKRDARAQQVHARHPCGALGGNRTLHHRFEGAVACAVSRRGQSQESQHGAKTLTTSDRNRSAAPPGRLELPADGLGNRCSIH